MENKQLMKMPEEELAIIPQQPINGQPSGLTPKKTRFSSIRKKPKLFIGIGLLILILVVSAIGGIWFEHELSPVGTDKATLIEVTIAPGVTPGSIGTTLQKNHIIRNSTAFELYTRFTRTQNELEAGTYRLSPGETTPEIVQHLVKGTVDQFSITFLPGATLAQNIGCR
jgi:cell division protein YceG involved in septum cleavage